jgi:hypothetical protein
MQKVTKEKAIRSVAQIKSTLLKDATKIPKIKATVIRLKGN